ncbi:hypothetical protein Ppb6_01900 [Photorhabdus australis subsp. thailandensis]|uniref:Uncharacterized protein n=1 Tax=Photorhabdus australis subsp. thailandensis TaxID=2805096 RepID=A0A1C0U4P0_9GAMM|nr:hypothetical protein Ppb6_01900 [Photorhabdus australis subsp. thailandensis]
MWQCEGSQVIQLIIVKLEAIVAVLLPSDPPQCVVIKTHRVGFYPQLSTVVIGFAAGFPQSAHIVPLVLICVRVGFPLNKITRRIIMLLYPTFRVPEHTVTQAPFEAQQARRVVFVLD